MKKSLIALLAICSTALADTAITLSNDVPAIQSAELCVDIEGLSATSVSSTPTFTITIGSRKSDTNVFAATFNFGRQLYDGLFAVESISPVLNEGSNSLTLSGSVQFLGNEILNDNNFRAWVGVSTSRDVQISNISEFSITLNLEENSSIATMTTLVSGSYSIENEYFQLNNTPKEHMATVSGHAPIFGKLVPEPGTATLSLLALAGLCMRRRRH